MSDIPSTPGPGGLSRIPFTVAAENQIKSLSFWLTDRRLAERHRRGRRLSSTWCCRTATSARSST